jgi:hypothetical protein
MNAPCPRHIAQQAIKALAFVDRHQVPAFTGGDMWAGGYLEWKEFQRDPPRYFARAPDEIADQIWAAFPPAPPDADTRMIAREAPTL